MASNPVMGARAARAVLARLLVALSSPAALAQPAVPPLDAEELQVLRVLQQIESAVSTSDRAAWLSLISANADPDAAGEFFDAAVPRGVTRAVVRERDRAPLDGALPGDGYRMIVEVFVESGPRGQLSTWRLDIRRPAGSVARPGESDTPWRVVAHDQLSQVAALHRLALDRERHYTANRVRDHLGGLRAAPAGRQRVRRQHRRRRLGAGAARRRPDDLQADAQDRAGPGAALRRYRRPRHPLRGGLRPRSARTTSSSTSPTARCAATPPEARLFARAREVFEEEVAKSFSLDLSDMSRDIWSILPQPGDMVAEVRTRRFRTMTYARAQSEAEDVTFFSRERKRNVSIYASPQKLASRGAFYDEDDLTEYDVLDYDVDVDVSPDREWLTGRAVMRLRVKSFVLGALTLTLADTYTISSITSKELGRLLFLRVRNQNGVVVNLPSPLSRDYELTLTIHYQGRIERQSINTESMAQDRPSRGPTTCR